MLKMCLNLKCIPNQFINVWVVDPPHLQQHVTWFNASICSHSSPLHDGANVDTSISSFVALAHNADAQEIVFLCVVEIKNSINTTHTHTHTIWSSCKKHWGLKTRKHQEFTDPCWEWRWWCSRTLWSLSRCWRRRPGVENHRFNMRCANTVTLSRTNSQLDNIVRLRKDQQYSTYPLQTWRALFPASTVAFKKPRSCALFCCTAEPISERVNKM